MAGYGYADGSGRAERRGAYDGEGGAASAGMARAQLQAGGGTGGSLALAGSMSDMSQPPSPSSGPVGAGSWDMQLVGAGAGAGQAAGASEFAGAAGVDQKVTALSRRTAAELKRAERERGEHSRRLEALEELCKQHLGGLEERLAQARAEATSEAERCSKRLRERFERELELLSAVLEQQKQTANAASATAEKNAEGIKALSKRVDANNERLEELQAWRKEADKLIAAAGENAAEGSTGKIDRFEAHVHDVEERFEERLESSLARERKQGHERLRSSCAELTAHLNELRTELLEQRNVFDGLEARRERLRHDLETQIAELGGALALRLQAKVTSTVKSLEERLSEVRQEAEERTNTLESSDEWLGGQVQQWRREQAELRGHVQGIQDLIRRESEQAVEVAREEARAVHMEVMSVDNRLATIEERLGEDGDARRYRALQRAQERSHAAAEGAMPPSGKALEKAAAFYVGRAPAAPAKSGA